MRIKQCKGFTLSETLITLVIIGIVAAITVPIVMNNIWEKTKAERIKNIKQKLSKSTDEMLATSGLNGYTSTEDFINTLKKHMKITQICKPENIQDCWGSKTVITDETGYEWSIKKTKSTKNLMIPSTRSGYKDIMGIVTADGTSIILSYDTDCNITLKDGRIWSEEQSSSLGCLSGVFDWNGGKKPNKLSDDVINFNASSGLGPYCAFKVNGNCYTAPQISAPMTKNDCNAVKAKYGIASCVYNADTWAGAVNICGGTSKMLSSSDFSTIASEIYGTNIAATDNIESGISKNNEIAAKYGLNQNIYVWTNNEQSAWGAYVRIFSKNSTTYFRYDRQRNGVYVICRGD